MTPRSRILSSSVRLLMLEAAEPGGEAGWTASQESLTRPCEVMRVCASEPG